MAAIAILGLLLGGASLARASDVAIAGSGSYYYLDDNGLVWAWGNNGKGALGDGSLTDRLVAMPVQVAPGVFLTDVVAITASYYCGFALRSDGTVWAWGNGNYGESGSVTQLLRATQVPGLSDITQIAAGIYNAYALDAAGQVWAWGYNYYGALGNGTFDASFVPNATPVLVQNGSGTLPSIVSIGAGGYHALAVDDGGTLWAWGYDAYGQCGQGAASVGTHTERTLAVPVSGLSGVVAASGCAFTTCARMSDGTLWSFGHNQYGTIGNNTTSSTPVFAPTQVVSEFDYKIFDSVKGAPDGYAFMASVFGSYVVGWGYNYYGQFGIETNNIATNYANPLPTFARELLGNPDSYLRTMAHYAVGSNVSLFHLGGPVVAACGYGLDGLYGQTEAPATCYFNPVRTSLSFGHIIQAQTGQVHSVILKDDGTVWTSGSNGSGQLGDNGATSSRSSFAQVPGLTDVIQIAAGHDFGDFCLALRRDGTVWAWGSNNYGQIGNGVIGTNALAPVQVRDASGTGFLTGIIAIAAGDYHSLAINSSFQVWAWGNDGNGQLGDNDASGTSKSLPVQVRSSTGSGTLGGIVSVAGGNTFSLALTSSGTVWAWGYNGYGALANTAATNPQRFPIQSRDASAPLAGIVRLAAGSYHALATKSTGTLYAWGSNSSFQGTSAGGTLTTATINGGLLGAVWLGGGDNHSLGIRGDGQLFAWGAGSVGQCGVGNNSNYPNPTLVSGVPNPISADGGYATSLVLTADGSLFGFGANYAGQTGTSGAASAPTPAATAWLPTVTIATTDASGSEAGDAMRFSISRSLGTEGPLSVTLALSGTADSVAGTLHGPDFAPIPNPITIPAGQASVTLVVTPNEDAEVESAETVVVTPQAVAGSYAVTGASGIGTIADNDTAGFTLSAPSGSTTEAGGAGHTFTFNVKLKSQPTGDVTVPVSSSNTQEGTVSTVSLTFTSGNWNVNHPVTVTGVPDNVDDGDQPYSVVLGTATSGDPNYSNANPNDVAMTSIDADTAGLVISAVTGTAVEDGTAATFTVKLATKPSANVFVPLSSADTGEITVSSTLTFTPANWFQAQPVTCTGIADQTDDGDQAVTVTIGATTSGDGKYAGLSGTRSVTNQDVDTTGISLTAIHGFVVEGGSNDRISLSLDTKPAGDVTVTVGDVDGELLLGGTPGAIDSASVVLTFTPLNWSDKQHVYVAAIDDHLIDGDIPANVSVVADSTGDPLYDAYATATVETAKDNDAAGILFSKATMQTGESSGAPISDSVVVSLTAQPTADVMVALHIPQAANGEADPQDQYEGSFDTTVGQGTTGTYDLLVTIPPGSWQSGVAVPVYGRRGSVGTQDGAQTYTITADPSASADTDFAGLASTPPTVTNSDVDQPGLTIVQSGGGTDVTENGSPDSYTIQLNTDPGAGRTVIVYPDLPVGTRISVSPAFVVFTSTGGKAWNLPQTITVTAIDDQQAQGTSSTIITHKTDVSTNANYSNKTFGALAATVTDNDSAGVLVSPTGGLTTSEAKTTANFSVVLTSQPTADVQIPISLDTAGASEGELSVGGGAYAATAALTFTAGNWATPQTVVVRGKDDSYDDGNIPYTVVLDPASASADATYAAINPADVSVVNSDDDAAGFVVAGGTMATTEAGGTDYFTVVLTSRPTANVVITVTSSNIDEGLVKRHADSTYTASTTLTFTNANWSTPKRIDVQGQPDQNVDDGDVSFSIQLQPDTTTSDLTYRNRDPADVDAVNANGDAAGIQVSTISGDTSEAGATATFTVVLTSRPTSDVTIPFTVGTAGELSLSPSELTFTPTGSDWSTPKTVTVTGLPDGIDDGDATVTVSAQLAISSDKAYNGLDAGSLTVVNDDIDTAGVVVAPDTAPAPVMSGSRYVTTEAGGSASFLVHLACQPQSSVQVPFASLNTNEGGVSATTLTFTTANWNVDQKLVVTGLAAGPAEANVNYAVQVGTPISTDGAYAALATSQLLMRNRPVNNEPSLASIADVVVDEVSGGATPVVVTISGVSSGQAREAQSLTFDAVSDDPSLITVDASAISYTQGDATAVLTFTPQPDAFGSVRLTVLLTDDGGTANGGVNTTSRSFIVTIRAVNDAPSFTKGAKVTVVEDSGPHSSAAWATAISTGPANESAQTVDFIVTAADTTLFAVQPAIAVDGTLTFTPADDAFGSTTVSVALHDDGGTANGGIDTSATKTFTIDITSANDAPVFTKGPDLSIAEDASAQTITNWATGIGAGAANEGGQTLAFALSVDDPALFAVAPSLSASGTLTFTPAANAAGIATVTLVLGDDGGTAHGGIDASAPVTSTISIVPVNDPPVAVISPAASRKVRIGDFITILGASTGAADLKASDVDSATPAPARDPALVFTLQLVPGAGLLKRAGVTLVAGDLFTQQDLFDGLITYHHSGGSGTSDGFAFTVTDSGIAADAVYAGSPALPPAISTPQVFPILIDRRPPNVQLLGTVPVYVENQVAPVLVADAGQISDSDSTDFRTGNIHASVGGYAPLATLSVRDQGTGIDQVSVVGSTVRVTKLVGGTVDVGTISGGVGADLIITCTSEMTPAAAQLVLRNLQFSTDDDDPPASADITVEITDDHGDLSAPVLRTIAITAVNDLPSAPPLALATVAGQAADGQIVVTDPDGPGLTFAPGVPVKGGLSAIAADGTFTYTPFSGQSGTDQFTVTLDDGLGTTDVLVTILISGSGVPGRPWIISDPPMEIGAGDLLTAPVEVDISGLATGFDVQFSLIGAPAGMTIVKDSPHSAQLGGWTAPTPGGTHVAFRIRATDATAGTIAEQPVILYVQSSTAPASN